MGSRVMVLGATGSVGRQVCAAFADRGADVVAVARRPAEHLSGYGFLPLDVTATEPARLAALLRDHRADVVVNAAGRWGPTEAEMIHSHEALVARLLAALALLPSPLRLVHLGSIHEYGPVPVGTAIDESVVPRPANAYARTKLAGSRAVLDAARDGLVDAIVLRCTNMYGPHPPEETFLAALVRQFRQAVPGEPIELTVAVARRDFVDVRDVADAVVLAAEAPAQSALGGARGPVPGRVLNIGSGVAVDVRDLVSAVVAAAGFDLDRVRLRPGQVASQGGDWVEVDIRLAVAALGWRPTRDLTESVRAMWNAAEPAPSDLDPSSARRYR